MINTIVAIDDQDETLGNFFSECLSDLDSFENETCKLIYIRSQALNELTISLKVPKDENFVFLAYSHGSETELLVSGKEPYISDTINIGCFSGALFYTCSCHTGKVLGELLIENKCMSYIGYNAKFWIWDFNRKPFVECANYGFKLFTTGDNIETIVGKMKLKYDELIDNYTNDFFGAAYLLSNKNSLVAYGNLRSSIDNFN